MAHDCSPPDLIDSGIKEILLWQLWSFKKVGEIPPEVEVIKEKIESMCVFFQIAQEKQHLNSKETENWDILSYSQQLYNKKLELCLSKTFILILPKEK